MVWYDKRHLALYAAQATLNDQAEKRNSHCLVLAIDR